MDITSTPSQRPYRRLLIVLLALVLTAAACSSDAGEDFAAEAVSDASDAVDVATEGAASGDAADGGDASSSFSDGDAADEAMEDEAAMEEEAMEDEEAMSDDDAGEVADSVEDEPVIEAEPERTPSAGLLTAGDIDDNLNFAFFNSILNDWQQEASFPSVNLNGRIVVDIVGDNGVGVGNLPLEISDGDTTQTVVTNSAGRVHVFPNWLGLSVTDGLSIQSGNDSWELTANDAEAGVAQFTAAGGDTTPPSALDVALVLDVTGSMADELAFLTAEFEAIVARLDDDYSNVDKRYALIVYRDVGDDFVTRVFDFTDTVGELQDSLAAQRADGGGDFPEAMDAALADATELSWSEGSDVARVLVLNADAPPQPQDAERTLDLAAELAQDGVRIYPLAASGVDRGAEFLMRTMGVTTGGRHLFLTADSGIGGDRLEPRAQCYDVTGLDDLLYRVLASELAGERIEADASQVIRTVGQVSNGVCA